MLSVCRIVRRIVREQLYNWCSLKVFAMISKHVIWRTVRRTARELFMSNARQIGRKGVLANSSANCSRAVHEQCSPGRQKNVIWRTVRRTVRERFMNNVRWRGKTCHLANNSANYSRTVHEQCSPELQNRSFGEQLGEMFAKSSANCSPKCTDTT